MSLIDFFILFICIYSYIVFVRFYFISPNVLIPETMLFTKLLSFCEVAFLPSVDIPVTGISLSNVCDILTFLPEFSDLNNACDSNTYVIEYRSLAEHLMNKDVPDGLRPFLAAVIAGHRVHFPDSDELYEYQFEIKGYRITEGGQVRMSYHHDKLHHDDSELSWVAVAQLSPVNLQESLWFQDCPTARAGHLVLGGSFDNRTNCDKDESRYHVSIPYQVGQLVFFMMV